MKLAAPRTLLEAADPPVNLSGVSVLLVESTRHGLKIMEQLLSGFGVGALTKCRWPDDAEALLELKSFDIVMAAADLEGAIDGFDLIRRLRRLSASPNRKAATILLCGHTRLSQVSKARDCGVNILITKPVSPATLMKRLLWLARDDRAFVDFGEAYVGPDRRFRDIPLPPGRVGRRSTDAPLMLGDPE